jgi:hypothetical protein
MDLVFFLIVSLIFFFLGRYSVNPRSDLDALKGGVEELKKRRFRYQAKKEVGAVPRPTAEQEKIQGTKMEEEDREMNRLFGRIVT